MWYPAFVALIALALYFVSIRRQLRFFFDTKKEVIGSISQTEPFFPENQEYPRWYTRCTVDYEVSRKQYKLIIIRDQPAQLGELLH